MPSYDAIVAEVVSGPPEIARELSAANLAPSWALKSRCRSRGYLVGVVRIYVLVDLVRFELTTSSMPFKKYQSLADSLAQNKRLSKRRRGLRWTPRAAFGASGLHADSGTPRTGRHVACFPARAVAGCYICCLPEETTIGFHIRMMPMWD